MSEPKFTKGPLFTRYLHSPHVTEIFTEENIPLAHVGLKANADLYAAAPELYTRLERHTSILAAVVVMLRAGSAFSADFVHELDAENWQSQQLLDKARGEPIDEKA